MQLLLFTPNLQARCESKMASTYSKSGKHNKMSHKRTANDKKSSHHPQEALPTLLQPSTELKASQEFIN